MKVIEVRRGATELYLRHILYHTGPYEGCLTWQVVQEKIPWGVILLLGGGFAMAEAADQSGMSQFIGEQLKALEVLPKVRRDQKVRLTPLF